MINNRYFLDTSFIIALINERDQYHQTANDLANYYDDSFLITSDAILLEIANGLSRNYKQEATQLIRILVKCRNSRNYPRYPWTVSSRIWFIQEFSR